MSIYQDSKTRESDESPRSEKVKVEAEEENSVHNPEKNDVLPESKDQNNILSNGTPTTPLEVAYHEALQRKELQIQRLTREITKLKAFISKRKQTYKRKRKDEGAPTRALSAYNIFVQDRFSKLAKDNEEALKSSDADAILKRVPPASLVASTGNEWKELTAVEKKVYEDKAAADRKRYEGQMAAYQPPEKQKNKKRNKTGYNMFFSAHVLELKKSDAGVPSERGSVARIVGNAWKELSSEQKQFYEREAEKQNMMQTGVNDENDGQNVLTRNIVHRPHLGPEIDSHDDRMGHREGQLQHHNTALMHQMMHGQGLHPGHHLSQQLGMAGHGYPHTPGQHHIAHQGQGYHGHQHQGTYRPLPPGHRGQPTHYTQHHSSYHQGSML